MIHMIQIYIIWFSLYDSLSVHYSSPVLVFFDIPECYANEIILHTSWFHVEALTLVKRAPGGIFSENCNVFPFRWVPIRVIITLLRTFISSSVAIRILTCVF